MHNIHTNAVIAIETSDFIRQSLTNLFSTDNVLGMRIYTLYTLAAKNWATDKKSTRFCILY